MFGEDFAENCIIMQFLGEEKDEKVAQRRDAEKRFEENQRRENCRGSKPRPT
jgi:hypothetical protein